MKTVIDLIKDEFPRYPVDTLPPDIPNWLQCLAWHNDAMPIWGNATYANGEGGIVLSIDYPDPKERSEVELESLPRFSVWLTNEMGDQISDTYQTDDWNEALVKLEQLAKGTVMSRISDTERAAGRRADYHVYYRKRGKLYFDPMWADSETEAKAKMLAFARELGWRVEVVRVERVTADS